MEGALRLSSHILARDPAQFASQITGRLLPYGDESRISEFLEKIPAVAPECWLRPLHPALHPPGTGLLRTLEGHSSVVGGVAVTPDGRRAVSASYDKTLKLWDLDTGRELRTLQGHSSLVSGVAVTPDGRRALSASDDRTLKLWDLETGQCLATFTCDAPVYCCACAIGGKIVAGDRGGHVHFLQLEERSAARATQL